MIASRQEINCKYLLTFINAQLISGISHEITIANLEMCTQRIYKRDQMCI